MTYKNPIIQYGYGFSSFLEIYTQKRDRRNCPLAFPSKKNEKEEKILLWFSSKIKKIKNEILTVILACIMCFLSFISINLQVNSSTLADTICNLKKKTQCLEYSFRKRPTLLLSLTMLCILRPQEQSYVAQAGFDEYIGTLYLAPTQFCLNLVPIIKLDFQMLLPSLWI